MGCIYLILSYSGNGLVNIEFTKSFMKMKKRGIDNTIIKEYKTLNITKMNENIIKSNMSKREIKEYKPLDIIIGNHRMRINDDTYDGDQPFEYPIEHMKIKYKELQTETKKLLICDGEIYNYKELIKDERITEKDIQSTSDVEVIMPLYKKYGLIETINKIKGEYNFILIENYNTFKYDEINITICKDIFGSRSLYYVKDKETFMYMFISEKKGIPAHIIENTSRYEIGELPNGTIWNFEKEMLYNRKMIEFYVYDEIKKQEIIYNTADEKSLTVLYNNMYDIIHKSVKEKVENINNVNILLDGNITSIIILVILIKYNYVKNINIYTYIENEELIERIKKINKFDNIFIYIIKDEYKDYSEVKNIIENNDNKIIESCFKYNILCKFKETNNVINKSRIILTGYGIKLFYTSDNNDETINKINNNKMKYLNKIACEWNSEFRYPYMEKELIHLIMSIDKNLKKNIQFGNKEYNYYLLRKMMEIYIPEYKDLYYLS